MGFAPPQGAINVAATPIRMPHYFLKARFNLKKSPWQCEQSHRVTPPRELWVCLERQRAASPSLSLPLSEAKGSGLRLMRSAWQGWTFLVVRNCHVHLNHA